MGCMARQRRNPDDDMRRLERLGAQGDPQAQAAFERARERILRTPLRPGQMLRQRIIAKANHASTASRRSGLLLPPNPSREQIIEWLVWNDRNGSYTDEDAASEGSPPLSLTEAWRLLAHALAEYELPDDQRSNPPKKRVSKPRRWKCSHCKATFMSAEPWPPACPACRTKGGVVGCREPPTHPDPWGGLPLCEYHARVQEKPGERHGLEGRARSAQASGDPRATFWPLMGMDELRDEFGGYSKNPPDDRRLVPVRAPDAFLPAIQIAATPAHEWKPPRVDFALLASGRGSLVYVPEGARERPEVTYALEALLTRSGIVSVDAWYDLFAAAEARGASLYVVSRDGERWRVLDVVHDYGGETGRLVVRHLGRDSQYGPREINIHSAFPRVPGTDRHEAYMIPVIVYRPVRGYT